MPLNHRDPAAQWKWVLKMDVWVSGTSQCYWALHSGVEVTSHWQKDLSFFKPHEHIRLHCGALAGTCAFSFDPHC